MKQCTQTRSEKLQSDGQICALLDVGNQIIIQRYSQKFSEALRMKFI